MTTFITRDELLELRYHSEVLCEEDIDTNYSGRGMYGDTCLGIRLERATDMIDLGVAIGECLADGAIRDEVVMALRDRAESDSLGLGTIIYWPRVKVEG